MTRRQGFCASVASGVPGCAGRASATVQAAVTRDGDAVAFAAFATDGRGLPGSRDGDEGASLTLVGRAPRDTGRT
jgi:hypothetical protein